MRPDHWPDHRGATRCLTDPGPRPHPGTAGTDRRRKRIALGRKRTGRSSDATSAGGAAEPVRGSHVESSRGLIDLRTRLRPSRFDGSRLNSEHPRAGGPQQCVVGMAAGRLHYGCASERFEHLPRVTRRHGGSTGAPVCLQERDPWSSGTARRPRNPQAERGPTPGHRPRGHRCRSAPRARKRAGGRAGRCQSPCTSVAGRSGEPARHTSGGSSAAARRTVASSVDRSMRRSRCGHPCGNRMVVDSPCRCASSRPASAHGAYSGCGTTVSTLGQRVRHRVPTGSGLGSSGVSRESDSAAMRSRVANALGSVPGRCSL